MVKKVIENEWQIVTKYEPVHKWTVLVSETMTRFYTGSSILLANLLRARIRGP
jgi:hypothetical protein